MVRFLVGAHGTGKSTLLATCREKYKEPFYTEGISRPVARNLKDLNIDPDTYQKIINQLTVAAYRQQIANYNIMATRSIIDVIIYTRVLTPHLSVEEYLGVWEETKHRVDKLIYVPIEFGLEEDEIRTGLFTNSSIQAEIDQGMQDFLKSVESDKVIRVTGSVEDRLRILEENNLFK